MVGEIRDVETARIAIEAALTGHMMLSTLHTNDAPGAIARLNEMGIESFLTASAVDCVVAQRLARRLCPNCKADYTVPASALAEAGIEAEGDIQGFEPVGCPRCGNSGYRGRVGIYSVMGLSERLKEMTVNMPQSPRSPPSPAKRGCSPFARHGVAKVSRGRNQPRGGSPCHSLISISPACSAVWSKSTPPTST